MNKLPLDVIDAIYERTDKIVALTFTMQGCTEQRKLTRSPAGSCAAPEN